jgi:protein TonB
VPQWGRAFPPFFRQGGADLSDTVFATFPPPIERPSLIAALRERLGSRALAIALALLIELLLALILLTLAPQILTPEEPVPMSVFNAAPDAVKVSPQPAPAKAAAPAARAAAQPQPRAEISVNPPVENPAPPPLMLNIPLARMPDIAALPRRPAAPRPVAGPPNLSILPGDTPRVEGQGPNGEPLYAASWYREPYDSELRGYLSTAQGPGWGRIACRTVRDYRVDSCFVVAEYPQGSNIARALLAAAWQFRVRPPRLGGQPQVGEWVRIHFDYGTRER